VLLMVSWRMPRLVWEGAGEDESNTITDISLITAI